MGLFAAGAAMGLNAVNGISDSVDAIVGPGLTAVWIGVLGLAMMATGLVLQSGSEFPSPPADQGIWISIILELASIAFMG